MGMGERRWVGEVGGEECVESWAWAWAWVG